MCLPRQINKGFLSRGLGPCVSTSRAPGIIDSPFHKVCISKVSGLALPGSGSQGSSIHHGAAAGLTQAPAAGSGSNRACNALPALPPLLVTGRRVSKVPRQSEGKHHYNPRDPDSFLLSRHQAFIPICSFLLFALGLLRFQGSV